MIRIPLLVLVALSVATTTARGVELSKIERVIGKEPVYINATPRYNEHSRAIVHCCDSLDYRNADQVRFRNIDRIESTRQRCSRREHIDRRIFMDVQVAIVNANHYLHGAVALCGNLRNNSRSQFVSDASRSCVRVEVL